MKKVLAVLALFAAVITVATAQEAAQKAEVKEEKTQNGPVMTFEATTVDYGEIAWDSDPYRVFTFKNTGTEPLVIKNAKASCGCTVPAYPKEPVPPGETGEIKVRYETKRVGPFTKTITLTTNAVEESQTLIIKGKVKAKEEEPAGLPAKESNPFNNN